MGLRTVLLIAVPVLAMVVVLGGCGGGSNGQAPISGGVGAAGATYVGNAVCGAACHTDIVNNQFTHTAHGQNFKNTHGTNFFDGAHASCEPCHTVGYGNTGGYVSIAATPQFEGIGCEDCHGPGSKHAGSPSTNAMPMPVPDASSTCFNCHLNTYKLMTKNPGQVYDADLYATVANKVKGPSHPQTLELMGVLAADLPVTPSPHSLIDNTCVSCHLNKNQGTLVLDPTITGTFGDLSIPSGADPLHGQGALAVDPPTCIPCHGSEAAAQTLYSGHKNEFLSEMIALGGVNPTALGSPDPACGGGMFAAFVTRHSINIATNTTAQQADPMVQAYKAARWNYNYLISDLSFGTHNPTLADNIIAQCQSLLSQ